VKTQGRRGEVAAELHTDFPELFAERRELFALAQSGIRRELRLEDYWPHKGRMVLKFEGFGSISEAEALLGLEIQIRREQRAPLEPGATYISDLVGCEVAVTDQRGERTLGAISDVLFGAGEAPLLVIREGSQEYLVPYVEAFIEELDTARKRIKLKLPEGMLDLDAPLSSAKKERPARKQGE
jgi:16S rRNA processing protein RimM